MNHDAPLQLKNDLAELDNVGRFVEEMGKRHHLPLAVVRAVGLSLDEIVTNVITHGYDDHDRHDIQIRLTVQGDEVVTEVEDDGRPFNPLELPDADTTSSLEDRPVGGLGIHLVKCLMDHVEYRRTEGRNLLITRKKMTA